MFSQDRSLRVRGWIGATIGALVFIASLAFAASRFGGSGASGPFADPFDFRAFYCAGAAVAQRTDPYRVEPDTSCQRRVLASAGLSLASRHVLPAPLPPYALVGFAALARLPYRLAASLWLSCNVFALAVSIVLLRRLSGLSYTIACAVLLVSVGVVSIGIGQPVPIVLAGALIAALCARAGNGIGAAAGATLASVEPHIALPIWLALALFVPAARRPLGTAAAALCLLSLVPGASLNAEYFANVLPLHARSELLNFGEQYALSPLLVALHVPFGRALVAGSLSYALMLGVGLLVGNALRARTGDRAFCVATPLATVVLGGAFLHIHQTAVAIPLGSMLAARLRRPTLAFGCAAIALALLAIPWQSVAESWPSSVRGKLPALTSAQRAALVRLPLPNESIEIPYTATVDAFGPRIYRRSFGELLAWKVPTWAALVALVSLAAWLGYGNRASRGYSIGACSESHDTAMLPLPLAAAPQAQLAVCRALGPRATVERGEGRNQLELPLAQIVEAPQAYNERCAEVI